VIAEPIEEGDKVKAEIVNILYKEQIKNIKSEGKWPPAFTNDRDGSAVSNGGKMRKQSDELFENTNRLGSVRDRKASSSSEFTTDEDDDGSIYQDEDCDYEEQKDGSSDSEGEDDYDEINFSDVTESGLTSEEG